MPRPALIVIDPVTPALTTLVHIAQVENWELIRNIVGVLPSDIVDGEVAICGDDWTQVCATAGFHGLLLLAPNQRWHRELPAEFLPPETGDVIEYEFRCFVVDRVVVAISPFRHRGASCKVRGVWNAPELLSEQAAEFCDQVLADDRIDAPPSFVLDVGMIAERWFVVDSRPAWATDPLGCGIAGVLEALKKCCFSRRTLNPSDARWIVYGTSLFADDIEQV